ncbi:MAG: biotin/lipoyl-containing protein, partial [Lysobacterales bacterium]
MSIEVKVPTLPESVPDATLLDWKKQVGEAVAQDEILVELETDKVVLEVPAPQGGILTEILKNTGDIAVVDDVLGRIDTSAAASPTTAAAPPPATSASAAATPGPALSPAVRKLVEENQLDPAAITGSGKGGRLTKGDVLAHLKSQQAVTPALVQAPATAPSMPSVTAPARRPGSREERREPMSRLR